MKNYMEKWENTPYPKMIRSLPEIEIPIKGIRGWLMHNDNKQIVFFDIEPVGKIPDHSHCSQWGFVLNGKMKLTIDNKTKLYKKGDWYYIPEGIAHSAEFLSKVCVIDIFDAPDRYKVKKS